MNRSMRVGIGIGRQAFRYLQKRSLNTILSKHQKDLLDQQRNLIQKTYHLLSSSIVDEASLERIWQYRDSTHVMDNLFVLFDNDNPNNVADGSAGVMFSMVIAGEFNAGKSTFINALLGQKLMESGVLPTTDAVHIVTSTENGNDVSGSEEKILPNGYVLHRIASSEILQDLVLVDTPGLNAVAVGHEEITRRLLPAADMIVFITSADRPFSESERLFLESIQPYRKRVVIVVNKIDILDSAGADYGLSEKQQVVDFVTDNCATLLGSRPVVYVVSARDALNAKLQALSSDPAFGSGSAMWKRSGFEGLEKYFKETLGSDAKVKEKLLSPLGVMEGSIKEALDMLKKKQDDIVVDEKTLKLLEEQMDAWVEDLENDITQDRTYMSNEIKKSIEPLIRFVENSSFLEKLHLSIDEDRFDTTVNEKLLCENQLSRSINSLLNESSDMIKVKTKAQGRSVIEYLGKRPSANKSHIIGEVLTISDFENSHKQLHQKLLSSTSSLLESYDLSKEIIKMKQSFKSTSILFGVIQMGALSAGLASWGILDNAAVSPEIIGFTTSIIISFSGIGVANNRHKRLENEIRDFLSDLQQKFDDVIFDITNREIVMIKRRIMDSVGPYSRFIRSEKERITTLRIECEDIITESHGLRSRIKKC